jgi:hypothetical protein
LLERMEKFDPLYTQINLYDPTKAVRSVATIPIKLQLCDGEPSASAGAGAAWRPGQVLDAGNANPDNDFRFDVSLGNTGGYIFNLKTTGLDTGTYTLNFTVTGDTFIYSTLFEACFHRLNQCGRFVKLVYYWRASTRFSREFTG